MNMKSMLRSAVMLSVAGTTLFAQSEPATGWTPTLEVRVLSSFPEGARASASSNQALVKGADPFAVNVGTGATLCSLGVGGIEGTSGPAARPNLWKLTGEYLGEKAGRHLVRVTSGFTRVEGRDSSTTTTQTLSLREGDSLVLDSLTTPNDNACHVHAVTMEARFVMEPTDPALARASYAADLWLVHTDPSGQEQREHLITNLDGFGAVPFRFSRLSFPVRVLDPRQGNTEAFIQLTGALRARTRTDGLVDLDVDTNRVIFGAERTDKPSSLTMPPARKTLTLKVDETTAIDFPPPGSGYVSLALGDAQAGGTGRIVAGARAGGAQGAATRDGVPVLVSGDRLVVNTSAFFKGHRTQLLVTLRRAR